jgi:hypothetical protein
MVRALRRQCRARHTADFTPTPQVPGIIPVALLPVAAAEAVIDGGEGNGVGSDGGGGRAGGSGGRGDNMVYTQRWFSEFGHACQRLHHLLCRPEVPGCALDAAALVAAIMQQVRVMRASWGALVRRDRGNAFRVTCF